MSCNTLFEPQFAEDSECGCETALQVGAFLVLVGEFGDAVGDVHFLGGLVLADAWFVGSRVCGLGAVCGRVKGDGRSHD